MKNPFSFAVSHLLKLYGATLQPLLRERFIDQNIMRLPGADKAFALAGNLFRLGRVPFAGERFPWLDPAKSNVSWIPINLGIAGADNIALPEEVLGRLIERASHRVIMNFCPCRQVNGCTHYPVETGCLMMGDSALKIPEKSRREVGVEEAKAHVRKAVEAGLVPILGKARVDNSLFMIPDEGKLLTTCFCCECCCITRYMRHVPPETLDKIQHPVEGLAIEVTDACTGCGACVSSCYIGAMEIKDGKASMGPLCRLCGRCAMACPQKAIQLVLDNSHAIDDVVARIESAVNHRA